MYVCLGASTFQMSDHCLLHYSKEQNNAVGLEVVLFGDFFLLLNRKITLLFKKDKNQRHPFKL